MKTITIEIPDGKKAEWVNGVLTLVDDKPQDPNEQIKSFEDAVRFLGIDEVDNVEHLFYAQGFLVSILASDEDIIRKINAYAKLITIATAWNEIDRFVRIGNIQANTSISLCSSIQEMLRGSFVRIRLVRLRLRLRITVLGFASKHANVQNNLESNSLTFGMIY